MFIAAQRPKPMKNHDETASAERRSPRTASSCTGWVVLLAMASLALTHLSQGRDARPHHGITLA
jgi:hypothetical protein